MGAVVKVGNVVLLVVDHHSFRRAAISSFLREWAERHALEVLGADPREPYEVLARPGWEMCVLSVGAAGAHPRWIAMIRILRGLAPERPVVVLAESERPRTVLAAHQAGAQGYLSTALEPRIAFAALSFILEGGSYFPPSVLDACPRPPDRPPGVALDKPRIGQESPPPSLGHDEARSPSLAAPAAVASPPEAGPRAFGLTDRQSVVLRHLRRGASNKEIARTLDMSEATVKVHVRQLLRKLGVANRTQAALVASCGRQDAPLPEPLDAEPPDPEALASSSLGPPSLGPPSLGAGLVAVGPLVVEPPDCEPRPAAAAEPSAPRPLRDLLAARAQIRAAVELRRSAAAPRPLPS